MTGRELEPMPDRRPVLHAVAADDPDGVDPTHWSVELDDEADDLADALEVESTDLVSVDPPDQPEPGNDLVRLPGPDPSASTGVVPWAGRQVERREIVPVWLRSRDERLAAARWATAHSWHVTAYHVVRVPTYAARLVGRAPTGAGRLILHTALWAVDAESKPVRQKAARDADATDYLRVANQHRELVKHRAALLGLVGLLAAITVTAVANSASTAVKVVLFAGLLAVLGLAGRRADKPVVDHATVTPRARRLTADIVTRAFVGAGLCKDDDPVVFPAPIARDGDGWRAVIDLPYGKTADQAIKKRTALASGLDLDEVQVWPDRVRGTAGSARRLTLWVADEDPYAKPSGPWPWAAAKTEASLFEPFPFGQDQRGRKVELSLLFTSLLVAAVPRMGKTFAARLPMLAAALDPHVQLHVYDGKGGADWRPFERVAHRFGLGARDEVVAALLADLRELKTQLEARYDVLGRLPVDRCPEGRITAALAADDTLGLHPVVIGIDEFQRYAEHPSYGPEIVDMLTDLAKVGPAAGIMVVLATQKPDPDSIPTRLRDVIGTRFCLRVMNWQSSDAALGAGAYTAGYDASRFQRAHKGVGWLLGADDSGAVEDAVTVRTNLAEPVDVEKIIDRAHAARVAAGTLTGHAAGEEPAQPVRVNVASDVRQVFRDSEDKVWNERLLERLRHHRPGYYDDWAPAQLTAALKPHGVPVDQVHGRLDDGSTANRRGVRLDDLDRALSVARATDRDRSTP